MSQAKFGMTAEEIRSFNSAGTAATAKPPSRPNLAAFKALEQAAGRIPTQSSAWYLAAARHLHRPNDTRLITVGDPSAYRALAPLVRGKNPELAMIAQGLINEPSDFLYDSDESLVKLLNSILQLGKPLLVRRLDAGSRVIDLLRTGTVRPAYHRIRPTHACPMLYLEERWTEPEACLASRTRQDLRRAMRKAEKIGKVTFSVVSPTPDDLPRLLETAFAIEASGWKGVTGSALLHDPERGSFIRDYARIAASQNELRIAMLYIGDRPAAMQLAVDAHGSRWLLKIGYEQEFASCSPGQILMRHSIAQAAAEQLNTFEFLGSVAPWTETWTHEHRECVALDIYPASLSSVWSLTRRVGRSMKSPNRLVSAARSVRSRLLDPPPRSAAWYQKT